MTLQSLTAFEFLILAHFPNLDGHISGTTSHSISLRIKANVINHTCMFSQSWFTLTCFIIPDLNGSIFTGRRYLSVNRMENYSGNPSTMTDQFQFLRFSWNSISSTLCNLSIIVSTIYFLLLNMTILGVFFLHWLHIDLVLFVNLLWLFQLPLQIHNLLLKPSNRCPLTL